MKKFPKISNAILLIFMAVLLYGCVNVPPLYYSPDGKILATEVKTKLAIAKKTKSFFNISEDSIERFGLFYKDSKPYVYGILRYSALFLEESDLTRINVEINLKTPNLLYVAMPVENLPKLEEVPGIDYFDIDKKGKIREQQAEELKRQTITEPEENISEPDTTVPDSTESSTSSI
ncbi:MAG TPA: hypothetical protein PK559_10900 [Ignavibacteriaceae bacterium]|nr:hypothetical protein [Ignavibacteriaceae bacterium]